MFTPKNNTSAVIGAAMATIAVFVLDALLRFFESGAVWPVTTEGWLRIVLPALCAGVAAVLFPHYSLSEARTGTRIVDSTKDGDAPVLDKSAVPMVVVTETVPVSVTPIPPIPSASQNPNSSFPAKDPVAPPGVSPH